MNRLGANEFEHLCQSLLKEIIGDGVTIFGDGPDGAREATFTGKAPYPSQSETWDGKWIFQAKFHNTQMARLDEDKLDLTPLVARIPSRINLKDYAQWLSSAGNNDGLEFYICEQVKGRSSTSVSPDEIQEIFHRNPCLLMLDGLDEVTDPGLQDKMIDRISEFLDRCEHVLEVDLHVLATSRPASYSDQFDSSRFIHLQLVRLKPEKVLEYVDRWTSAAFVKR